MSRLIKQITNKFLADETSSLNILYYPNKLLFDMELMNNSPHQFYIMGQHQFDMPNVSSIDLNTIAQSLSISFDLLISNDPFSLEKTKTITQIIENFKIPAAFIHHEEPADMKLENKFLITKDLSDFPNFVVHDSLKDSLMMPDAQTITQNFNQYILNIIK